MNRSDLPRVALATAELGQLLGRQAVIAGTPGHTTVAEAALAAAREHQPGPAAARLEPSHGRPREEVTWPEGDLELVDVPNDRTGEAAIATDRTAALPGEWLDAMSELDRATARVARLVDVLLPPQPGTRPARCGECGAPRLVAAARDTSSTSADIALEGWCASCHRLDKRLQPIETDKRGNRYYRDLCRWCGGFKAKHKVLPPLELLDHHHRYGRVTTTQVARAMAKAKREAPSGKGKKKRKARRAA